MQTSRATQTQRMMLFVLSMTLYGIACLFSELLPKFNIGIFELSAKYFLFIPLSLAMLFEPMPIALGASMGKLVFGSMMLGKFKGFGSFKKFFTVAIGVYIAGRMVKNPKNKKMVAVAAITGTAVQLILGTAIDIALYNLAVSDFDSIPGLPESVYAVRGFEALNDLLFTGVLFCLLPTMYMVPRLYGKIEPLMGIKPRDEKTVLSGERSLTVKVVIWSVLGFFAAFGSDYLYEIGVKFIGEKSPFFNNTLFVCAVIGVMIIITVARWTKQSRKNRHE